jgi:trk system potassium uptake protein TrkH
MANHGFTKELSPARILVIGFALLALVGGVLLSLPVASQSGQGLPFIDALFTATSALCVTGLVVVDTGSYFSHFGQIVILLLIQIGGLGFMTVATFIMILSGKRIGLRERLVIQEALNVGTLEGLVRLSRNIVLITIIIELFFAMILAVRFSFIMPWYRAIYFGVFHSVSAFNNAGFDLFGGFRSLTSFVADPTVNLVIMILIILGGIGFSVMVEVWKTPKFSRFSLHTKLVLIATGFLLLIGALGYFVFEYNNPKTLGPLTLGGKIWASLFASTTARTAGYATIDYGAITDTSKFWTVILMYIGASPGSTGGGIKTVTTASILLYVWSVISGRDSTVVFHRQIAMRTIYKSLVIAVISAMLIVFVTMILTVTEHKEFLRLLFETTSAFGTVGLSTNLTPELSVAGRIIITCMMFIGRVGPLTLAIALAQRYKEKAEIKYPEGKLFVG